MNNKTTVLMILSGFGLNKESNGNAIKSAKTPTIDKLLKQYPNSALKSAGTDVRLTRRTDGKL